MSETNTEIFHGVKIDRTKALKLRSKILSMEKTNLKTKEKNSREMVEMIKKMIEEDVEC